VIAFLGWLALGRTAIRRQETAQASAGAPTGARAQEGLALKVVGPRDGSTKIECHRRFTVSGLYPSLWSRIVHAGDRDRRPGRSARILEGKFCF
jgi:hypothetical protein